MRRELSENHYPCRGAADGIFEIVTVRNDGKHYARTCEEWLRRLRANKANKEEAIALVGEEVFNRYDRYLKMSAIGFHNT